MYVSIRQFFLVTSPKLDESIIDQSITSIDWRKKRDDLKIMLLRHEIRSWTCTEIPHIKSRLPHDPYSWTDNFFLINCSKNSFPSPASKVDIFCASSVGAKSYIIVENDDQWRECQFDWGNYGLVLKYII